jgi:hypothetical protein
LKPFRSNVVHPISHGMEPTWEPTKRIQTDIFPGWLLSILGRVSRERWQERSSQPQISFAEGCVCWFVRDHSQGFIGSARSKTLTSLGPVRPPWTLLSAGCCQCNRSLCGCNHGGCWIVNGLVISSLVNMISKPRIFMHFLSLIFLESADILGFADVQMSTGLPCVWCEKHLWHSRGEAERHLMVTHPVRLGVALNYAVGAQGEWSKKLSGCSVNYGEWWWMVNSFMDPVDGIWWICYVIKLCFVNVLWFVWIEILSYE